MASRLRVAVAGATGETGQSIMDPLLANPEEFEVFALARPVSVNKPILSAFPARGAIVKSVDFNATDALITALAGMHVVISCLLGLHDKIQIALRFVPSFFEPACPPRGVMKARDRKEDMLDRIQLLYLPYKFINFGWWYQLGLPPLPSGHIQTRLDYALNEIMGDGEAPFALVDKRDIGKYVARIITDPRTLNKMVFGNGEVWTQNRILDTLEEMAGEKLVRRNLIKEDMDDIISGAYNILATIPRT
ncbi:isoflavone reductase family protein [Clohesyomyces aquaticus]|uniref:Isoflavone reductase family protein n=1 Tax=Clohesyomyces aquaticus TaxID=1231657 RepID=A0A1Y2A7P0_9PLEO|nr:isoflavone reductase family protein [Clohesyomyces aquaticus]